MLLQNVAQEEAAAQSFYQTYFCDILQHIFSVVTDTSHTAGEVLRNSVMHCPVSSMQSENIDPMANLCYCFGLNNVISLRIELI